MKIIIAKCVSCNNRKEIMPFEIKKGENPICDKCFMPMFAEKVVIKCQHQ